MLGIPERGRRPQPARYSPVLLAAVISRLVPEQARRVVQKLQVKGLIPASAGVVGGSCSTSGPLRVCPQALVPPIWGRQSSGPTLNVSKPTD